MKNLIVLFFAIAIIFVALNGCKKDDAGTNPTTPTTKTMTLAHFGVDFSEGKVGDPGTPLANEKIDGETIAWCPNGSGGGWMQGIWFRSRDDKLYRIGPGDLATIKSIDTTKWSADVCGTALKNGDIWAAKALDGFVVFKVTAVATDSAGIANGPATWPATIEYKFSTTTTFQ
ncbi:hypothetical protein MASR1M107_16860 [Ignavibacteriales bacterium]